MRVTSANQSLPVQPQKSAQASVATEAPKPPAEVDKVHLSSPQDEPKGPSKVGSFLKHGAVIAGGLAVGIGAASLGLMGGAAGAVAGAVGGVALGVAAVAGLGAAAMVSLAKSGPAGILLVIGLIALGAVASPFVGGALIAGGVAGGAACAAIGHAGGPVAAALAGTGCGLAGAGIVSSFQKAFAK